MTVSAKKKKKGHNKNGLILNLVNMVILMICKATDQALWDKKVGRAGMELGKACFPPWKQECFQLSYFNRTLSQNPIEEWTMKLHKSRYICHIHYISPILGTKPGT